MRSLLAAVNRPSGFRVFTHLKIATPVQPPVDDVRGRQVGRANYQCMRFKSA